MVERSIGGRGLRRSARADRVVDGRIAVVRGGRGVLRVGAHARMRAGRVAARLRDMRAAGGVAPGTGRPTGLGVIARGFTFRGRPAEDRGLIGALVGPPIHGDFGVAAGAHVQDVAARALLAVLVGPFGVALDARGRVRRAGGPATLRDVDLRVGLGPLAVTSGGPAVLALGFGRVGRSAARVRFGRGRLISRGRPPGQSLRGREHRNQETKSSSGCQQMFLHGKPSFVCGHS